MTMVGYLSGWVSLCCGALVQRNIIIHNDGGPDTLTLGSVGLAIRGG